MDERESQWSSCIAALGIRGDNFLWQSPYDPLRRTYATEDRVYKVQLLQNDSPAGPRAQDLAGEYAILKRCEAITGIPSAVRYYRHENFEALVVKRVRGEPLTGLAVGWFRFLVVLAKLATLLIRMSRRGVSHNDIRPENVLVSDDGIVSVIDFDQATQATFLPALIRSFVGISVGEGMVHHSFLTILKRYLAKSLSPRTVPVLRKLLRRPGKGDQQLPSLPDNPSPQLRLLRAAWELAQRSDASSPGRKLAYYSLDFQGCHFPGERPWIERWNTLRTVTDCSGKRVLELGCNVALLSCFLLREGGATTALAVDVDEQILRAARLVASALDVKLDLRQTDFDDPADWEAPLSDYRPDVVFALNVLKWVRDKDRFMSFLARFNEVIFEGHESPELESLRFRDAGFERMELLGITDRGRPLLRCSK